MNETTLVIIKVKVKKNKIITSLIKKSLTQILIITIFPLSIKFNNKRGEKMATYIEGKIRTIEKTEDDYDNYLDEVVGVVEAGGVKTNGSRFIKMFDEIQYNVGFAEWQRNEERFQCVECGSEFEDEDEAKDCCPKWLCKECGSEFEDEDEADECCEGEEDLQEWFECSVCGDNHCTQYNADECCADKKELPDDQI